MNSFGAPKKGADKTRGTRGAGGNIRMEEGYGKAKHWIKFIQVEFWAIFGAGVNLGATFFPSPTCPLAESAIDNRLALPAPLPLPPPMLY